MKNFTLFFILSIILIFCFSCTPKMSENQISENANPPATGFDLKNSDAKAIQIADQVMLAMGGRKAYDETRYLFWNFFGSRTLLWDKHKGDVRIESKKDDFTVMMNIHTMKGKVKMGGVELTHPDSLSKYLDKGKSIWINDSYWLVMPYKLKDSGVSLNYVGEEENEGIKTNVLDLTFKNVGKTPDNKYRVYVDQKTNLINKWDFYTKATDEKPRFSTPWDGYKKHGKIMLSGGRGTYQLTEIKVMEKVEKEIFEKF